MAKAQKTLKSAARHRREIERWQREKLATIAPNASETCIRKLLEAAKPGCRDVEAVVTEVVEQWGRRHQVRPARPPGKARRS